MVPGSLPGNLVTIALMGVAIAFAIVLTHSSGRRIPGPVILVLGAGATGLLAPVLVGLPAGLLVGVAAGAPLGNGDGMKAWAFAIVYAGFGLLGVALTTLVGVYVLERWNQLFTAWPRPGRGPIRVIGGLGLVPFGAAMAYWGMFGPGSSGPFSWEMPTQRTVLFASGVLALAAYAVPLFARTSERGLRLAWLITWTGCCVAAVQGPTQLLLAQDAQLQPLVALIAALATPGATLYGLSILRRRLDAVSPSRRQGIKAQLPQ